MVETNREKGELQLWGCFERVDVLSSVVLMGEEKGRSGHIDIMQRVVEGLVARV
jgi:hypothetical protein